MSQTSDATGGWYRYAFQYTNFPDYPKAGVWPDAYYVTFNMFNGNSFEGARLCAYDRNSMLSGAPATQQCFEQPTTAFGILLSEGIGDTIRVSLSAPPAQEVKVGLQILQSLNLRERKLEIVSCPSCGRAQVDVYTLANDVTAGLEGMTVPLRVAVMGCVVNGPGEAREADLGVASGNGKGQIFVKGEVIKTVPESEIVATLIEEANRLAAEMPPGQLGSPEVVTV